MNQNTPQPTKLQLVIQKAKSVNLRPKRAPLNPDALLPVMRPMIAEAVEAGRCIAGVAQEYNVASIATAEVWMRHVKGKLERRLDTLERRVIRLERINGVAA